MRKVFLFAILYFIVVFSHHLYGETNDNGLKVMKDMEKSLLIYSAQQDNYVPFPYETPLKNNAVSFVLDLKENSGFYLKVCAQPNSGLFIQQKIVASQQVDRCLLLEIDSLRKAYETNSLFITLYHKNLDLKATKLLVVQRNGLEEIASEQNSKAVKIMPREASPYKNFFIIGLLVIMAVFAMVKVSYTKIFNEFYSIGKIFSFKWREDSIIANRPISSVNFLFLVLYCLVMAFVIQSLWFETDGVPGKLDFISLTGFSSSLFSWLILALLVFFVMIIKYIIIKVTSSLLGFKDLVSFHFLDFIRISQLFLFLLLILLTFSVLSFKDFIVPNGTFFPYIIGICVLLTVFLLFFKLLTTSTYRNVQLFSYLCTTEILPLIIGIKFFSDL